MVDWYAPTISASSDSDNLRPIASSSLYRVNDGMAVATKPADPRPFEYDEKLHIRLANDPELVTVDLRLVQLFSKVARGLPYSTDCTPIWDLSGLLVEGKPVSRAILIEWLNVAYRLIYAAEYEAGGTPGHLTANDAVTAEQLVQLLGFVDAVGSTEGLLQAIVARVENAVITIVANADNRERKLPVTELGYYWSTAKGSSVSGGADLYHKGPHDKPTTNCKLFNVKETTAFAEQVVAQTEQMFYLATKLRIASLSRRVREFIKACSADPTTPSVFLLYVPLFDASVLSNIVYSSRVLDLLQYSEEEGRKAWIAIHLESSL